jgi:hypothetical protein
MKQAIDTSDLVQRFNEDEVVWRSYEHKRELRRRLGSQSPLPEAVLDYLDYLDWLEAERECRTTRCIGRPAP